jgi:hypothetical protein
MENYKFKIGDLVYCNANALLKMSVLSVRTLYDIRNEYQLVKCMWVTKKKEKIRIAEFPDKCLILIKN